MKRQTVTLLTSFLLLVSVFSKFLIINVPCMGDVKVDCYTGYPLKREGEIVGYVVTGFIVNNLPSTIENVWVKATFYDENGNELSTKNAKIEFPWVPSGYRAPFHIYKFEAADKVADYEVQVESYDVSNRQIEKKLQITYAFFRYLGYTGAIEGSIKNIGDDIEKEGLIVFGAVFDEKGEIIDCSADTAPIKEEKLYRYGQTSFHIPLARNLSEIEVNVRKIFVTAYSRLPDYIVESELEQIVPEPDGQASGSPNVWQTIIIVVFIITSVLILVLYIVLRRRNKRKIRRKRFRSRVIRQK